MWDFVGWVIGVIAAAAWITALITDATNERIAWTIVDLMVFPIGIIRGLIYWFT